MKLPELKKNLLLRRIAGPLVVLVYGVVMMATANHAISQADPIPQRTWKPTGKNSTNRAMARQTMNPSAPSQHPSFRLTDQGSPLAALGNAELRSAYLLYGSSMLGINPFDATRHPWPHTGEWIDDCSTTVADEGPLKFSM